MGWSATSSTDSGVDHQTPEVLVVAGPTATGKSALGLALAAHYDGTIINADSIQCYRDLPILTARPTAEDEARAPHRLFGFLGPKEQMSAAAWADRAATEIRAVRDEGRVPIVVGGTGLYLMALMEGLAEIPPIPDEIRTEARDMTARIGPPYMHKMLAERDPETAARISSNDPQRIARAWEVLEATGQPISWWQNQPTRPPIAARYFSMVLMPTRETLHDLCNRRFDAMLAAGAIDQVRALAESGVGDTAAVMRALGARELLAHILGGAPLAGATEAAKAATRQYAKRQTTWFKNQFHANYTSDTQFYERLLPEIFTKIDRFLLTGHPGGD